MIGAIENNHNINAVRLFNATNAFNKTNSAKTETPDLTRDAGTEIKENSILRNINVSEIKEYANSVGETKLDEEDIKYGLKFGRSVLVNYSV